MAAQAFDRATGLWAGWLCGLSPLLVYYSREVRMYALLVPITCLGWGSLFARRRAPRPWWLWLYGLSVVALVYTHPLGLLMTAALALASMLFRRAFAITWRGWLLTHAAVGLGLLPWVGRYFDHEPESVSGLLPLKFLLGMPIGFIGGNFVVLLLIVVLIGYGQCFYRGREPGRLRIGLEDPIACVSLLIWLVLPVLLLYAYSRIAQPVFGPAVHRVLRPGLSDPGGPWARQTAGGRALPGCRRQCGDFGSFVVEHGLSSRPESRLARSGRFP